MALKYPWHCAGSVCCLLLALTSLGVAIFCLTGVENMIRKMAVQKSALSKDSYSQWGQIPGEFNVVVNRNYTFFNFKNPFEVFYLNATPIFVESKGYLYQEYQNFINVSYLDPDSDGVGSLVNYSLQVQSKPYPNTATHDPIETVNLGAIGFWYGVHNLTEPQVATFAMAQLIFSLEVDIPETLQAVGISAFCVKDFPTAASFFSAAGISDPDLQAFMWNDTVNGLSQRKNLNLWTRAVLGGPISGAGNLLEDYFYLDGQQTQQLLGPKGKLATCLGSVLNLIAKGYACDNNTCEPSYLTQLQWSGQNITKKPAGGFIPPEDSVTYFNSTVQGWLEISLYLEKQFAQDLPEGVDPTPFQSVTFTQGLAQVLLNHTATTGNPYNVCTNWDTLLHSGNLDYFYQIGTKFDAKQNFDDLSSLQPLMDRFNLTSLEQTVVLWYYIKYFHDIVAIRKDINGTIDETIIGQFTSQALYNYFYQTRDFLHDYMTSYLILNNLTAKGYDCKKVFQVSTNIVNETILNKICNYSHLNPFNVESMTFLMHACDDLSGYEYNLLLNEAGVPLMDLETFCTPTDEPEAFYMIMLANQDYLKNFYNCSPSFPGSFRCSDHEIAVMQWTNSTITRNIPDLLKENFTSADSLNTWFPDKFSKVFEYTPVLALMAANFESPDDMAPMDLAIANQLLTFDSLFSISKVQYAFILFKNNNMTEFDANFQTKPHPLIVYLRYAMMDLALGGFSQNRTVSELLGGYEDPILVMLKSKNPLDSGDPSIPTIISLGGQNSTEADAANYDVTMFSGVNNSKLTKVYQSFFEKTFIAFPNFYFDGNVTHNFYDNPWRERIPLAGSDGSVNAPYLNSNENFSIYIPDANYQAELWWSQQTVNYNGVDSLRYNLVPEALLSKQNYSENAKWFADKYNGLINISTIHKAPLFVSKAHLYGVDKELYEAIKMYSDDKEKNLIVPSASDDLYLDIEPYSGVSIGASANFQSNCYIKPDGLFVSPVEAMLPLVITQRGTSFTDDQISTIFGPLKQGLFLKNYGSAIFFPVMGVTLLLSIFFLVRRKRLLKVEELPLSSHFLDASDRSDHSDPKDKTR